MDVDVSPQAVSPSSPQLFILAALRLWSGPRCQEPGNQETSAPAVALLTSRAASGVPAQVFTARTRTSSGCPCFNSPPPGLELRGGEWKTEGKWMSSGFC